MIPGRRPEVGDVIVAVATPPGRGALGTVRLSGPGAGGLAARVFRPWRAGARSGAPEEPFPPPRQAVSGTVRAPAGAASAAGPGGAGTSGGEADGSLDRGVLVFFPADSSPTGEDLAEITVHGSPVVLAVLVRALQRLGARPALPGEFSYRAFLNGRLDAAQAEAVDDLVRARSEHQARAAHRRQTGALARAVAPVREALVDWLARLEGSLEFGESDAEDFLPAGASAPGLEEAAAGLQRLLADAGHGLALARGARVVLAGAVNAGKSSLFNAWLASDRAIVSPSPGTTRDLLEADVEWQGLPVTLVDTAGERPEEAPDQVEEEGRRRGAAARDEADLVIWLLDGAAAPAAPPPPWPEEAPAMLVAVTKADLGPPRDADAAAGALPVSTRTGAGLDELRRAALDRLLPPGDRGELPLIGRLRQQGCLERAAAGLAEARRLAAEGAGEELVVLPLQEAIRELAELTGSGGRDEVYHRIFARFCIGK